MTNDHDGRTSAVARNDQGSGNARRALVVGGTGFAGSYLAEQLARRYAVTVTGRTHDIRDPHAMRTAVSHASPDIVVNLAALTTVGETLARPRETYEVGVDGLSNLFKALNQTGFRGRFLQVSSSEVYGFPNKTDLPLTEDRPPQPKNPYAAAKLAGEALCHRWNLSGPFEIVIARPFTHIGPGQSTRFAVASFTRQIAEIILGRRQPLIKVGNLAATRDLTDVRDVVRAYDLAIHQGHADAIYNVCSARAVVMADVLNQLVELSGISIEVEQDDALVRDAEPQRLCGSHARLSADTGWWPRIPLRQTLLDMLEFETQRLAEMPADAYRARSSG
jgi:GDP-4-dehydro-6-deoxy-D-mannose reductase